MISFSVAAIVLAGLIIFDAKIKRKDTRKSKRHIHKKGISRFGGVALITSFVVGILFDSNLVISAPLLGVLFGCGMILILGVVDDCMQMSWKSQLFFQVMIVMFVYIMGVRLEYITNPFGGVFLFSGGIWYTVGLSISICWVIFLMNAMNWIDGVDGVVGGVTLVGVISIFILSIRPEVNQPPVGIVAAVLAGSLLAFIFMNFYPAKILAGSSGSIFMGYILAIMAIFAGAKIATTLLVLAVPVIDALWVIFERWRAGDSIFSPDKKHLHYRLMELGWSSSKICLFYYGITIVVAFIALNTNALGKMFCLGLITIFMLLVLFSIRRRLIFLQKK